MAKINRFSGDVKAIASESQAGERYVFGSTSVTSDDLTDQMTNAILRGWATVGPSDFPPLEWFNAVAFTATQFNSYLHQMGVAEWDALQEYPTDGALVIHNGAQWSRSTGWVVGDEPGVASTWLKLGSVNAQVLTTSQTYTPPDNVRSVKVTLIGGGGGGGGADGQAYGSAAAGAGGGAGGVCILTTSSIDTSYNVTIGSGGSGGAAGNNSGATGGISTVVSTSVNMTANGGGGGEGCLGDTLNEEAAGGVGGTSSGGDINIKGNSSRDGRVISGVVAQDGSSAPGYFGGGVSSTGFGGPYHASDFGVGGAGSSAINTSSNFAGGDGYQGVCIIEEYY